MSDAYERAKAGRLLFKGGEVASRSKAIDKKSKKKKKHKNPKGNPDEDAGAGGVEVAAGEVIEAGGEGQSGGGGGEGGEGSVYTIDAAKKRKYEELFPVEARKFGYDPKFKAKTVEDALDDRVKKKADRYCK